MPSRTSTGAHTVDSARCGKFSGSQLSAFAGGDGWVDDEMRQEIAHHLQHCAKCDQLVNSRTALHEHHQTLVTASN